MADRKELSQLLRSILGPDAANLYFQPPEDVRLKYDCIIYKRSGIDVRHADNAPYKMDNRYTITYITQNPDSKIPDELARLPRCRLSTNFTKSNLYHWVFELYHK